MSSAQPATNTVTRGVFGVLALLYGVLAYLIFLATFLYAIAFVGNLGVPRAIDIGPSAPLGEALLIDIGLLLLFAVQHSVMARRAFKRWWTCYVPVPIERSTYVLLASVVLTTLCWQWRPIPDPVWTVTDPAAVTAITVVFWLGWTILLISTFLISHFELFGLTQVVVRLLNRKMPPPVFRTPYFYKRVRHPLYLGFLLAFWATPLMTMGHLLFSVATTGYILIAIALEERDLIALFGDEYRRYRAQVGMLLPIPGRKFAPRPPMPPSPSEQQPS